MTNKIFFLGFLAICLCVDSKQKFDSFIQYPCSDNKHIFFKVQPALFRGGKFLWTLMIHAQFDKGTKFNMTIQDLSPSEFQTKWLHKYKLEGHENYVGQLTQSITSLRLPIDLPTDKIPVIESLEINNEEICKRPGSSTLDTKLTKLSKNKSGRVKRQTKGSPMKEIFECGVRRKKKFTSLIVHGTKTGAGDWPWHVALSRWNDNEGESMYICGGTLISQSLILTAAHCVVDNTGLPHSEDDFSVLLGAYKISDTNVVVKKVKEIIVNVGYDYDTQENDIALLRLTSPVIFDQNVQPACIWKPEFSELPKLNGTVVGWGIDETDSIVDELQQAYLPKIEPRKCLQSNRAFFGLKLADSNFCAGYQNGTSPCNGDSGGGFHVFFPDTPGDTSANATGKWYVHGVTSLAISRKDKKVCDPNNYVLFTDAGVFYGWIQEYMCF